MSAPLIFPPLSNSLLRFPHNTKEIPKFILFSKPPRADHLSTNSTQATAIDDDDNDDDNTGISSSIESKAEGFSLSSMASSSNSSALVKAPTAPWMNGPLLVETTQILDLSNPRTKKGAAFIEVKETDKSFRKVGSGRGKREMKMIFRGIEELQEKRSSEEVEVERDEEEVRFKFKFSPGELWGEGSSVHDEEDVFYGKENKSVDTEKSMGIFEFVIPRGEVEGRGKAVAVRKMPWDRDKKLVYGRMKKEKTVTAAELSLDKELLERLRNEASRMRKWVKVKKAGVTQAVVDQVNLTWKDNELAMLKFDLPLSRNMERAREIVEIKTRGLVVWRKRDALFVYRGKREPLPSDTSLRTVAKFVGSSENSSFGDYCQDAVGSIHTNSNQSSIADLNRATDNIKEMLSNRSLYEKEADRLLDGLGPRFVDWWGQKPLPVDGDLLPLMVPGFQPQVRLCPPCSKAKLTDDELTYLRNLAHSLPTHFVLGRNRKLQGLAVSILKLWEKCHVAKIAIKWGVPNTDNKQMAYELKCLTGGVLLLRNKFIIILYRGKDFLPSQVGELVAERELEIMRCQLWEETARLRASEAISLSEMSSGISSALGTLSEFQSIQSKHLSLKTKNSEVEVQLEAEKQRIEKELHNQQYKLLILKKKIEVSAKRLAELNSAWEPAGEDADQEMITPEERECLRQIGLKMESIIVLGRRGVFCGVIESLHQHWKYREIAKVITMQRSFSQVIYTAKFLEAESKGMLVSIEKLKKGHAIIIYRGKNYRRPKRVVPNLLDKREALSRSIEMQRIGSLKYFASQREQTIFSLKSKLAGLMEYRV